MQKPIYRIQHQKEADHHAQISCSFKNLEKGSQSYKKEYEKAFKEYMDGIHDAMTIQHNPTMIQNPSTPKIPLYLYEEFDLWQKGGFIDSLAREQNLSKHDEDELRLNFRSAVGTLVQIYLKLHGMKTKSELKEGISPKDTISAFQYVDMNEMSEAQKTMEMIQVEINRYIRMFVATVIIDSLDRNIFRSGGEKKEDIGKYLMASDLLDKDIESNAVTFNSIKTKQARIGFIKRLMNLLKKRK